MLNLGEYYVNNAHMNISTELQVAQAKFQNFPSGVKYEMAKHEEGN